jgi:hypothetical protein
MVVRRSKCALDYSHAASRERQHAVANSGVTLFVLLRHCIHLQCAHVYNTSHSMSSSSSNQSGHAPAIASSSRSQLTPSPGEDDFSDDGLDIGNEELLADDPLHGDGHLNERYIAR